MRWGAAAARIPDAGPHPAQATDLFQTVDLYEAKNMTLVVNGIHALGRAAQRAKFSG